MGICWGDPNYPTPTHTACLKSRMNLTISSISSSESSDSFNPRLWSESNKAFPANGQILEEPTLTEFTFTQLKAATKNFGADSLLGEGGFGQVFKGSIEEKATSESRKSIIAVKKLNQDSLQGFNEWKSYTAKLSDFGLAKLGPSEDESHVSTRVVGTCGYAAPEYVAYGHLYINSDVYGFGVVLLELLTGRQVLDRKRPAKEQNLVTWCQRRLPRKGNLVAMMDFRLKGKYSLEAAAEVAQLALKCVRDHPDQRPSMTEVVEELERIEVASAGSSYH